jgi:predicted Zn-dependent peptidase
MAKRRGWVLVFVALVCGCSGASRRAPAVDENELRLPTPATIKLRNGVKVWHVRSTKIPMVELSLRFRCGSVQDPPAKHGLAALTFAMLDEGAGSRDALALADEIDFLAAELVTGAERDFSGARLGTLKRNLDAALDIFADVVLRPRLEEEDWQRVRTLWLGELAQSRDQPNLVARRVGDRAFYGDGQPYAHPVTGYSETVSWRVVSEIGAERRPIQTIRKIQRIKPWATTIRRATPVPRS